MNTKCHWQKNIIYIYKMITKQKKKIDKYLMFVKIILNGAVEITIKKQGQNPMLLT